MTIKHIALALVIAAISTGVASAEPRVPTGWTSKYPAFAEDIKNLGTEGALKKYLQIGSTHARPLESYTQQDFQEAYTKMGLVPLYGPIKIPAPLTDEQIEAKFARIR